MTRSEHHEPSGSNNRIHLFCLYTWFASRPRRSHQDTLTENTSLYFYSQIPIARDFNGNLAQGVSYVFGITKLFQVMNPS